MWSLLNYFIYATSCHLKKDDFGIIFEYKVNHVETISHPFPMSESINITMF